MDRIFDFLPVMLGAPGGSGGAPAGGSGQLVTTFATFGLVILIFYFLIIRPQSKRKKDTEKMLQALKKGDRVVTIGGIRGTVVSVKEESVVVKVDENTKLELNRSAVSSIVSRDEGKQEDSKQDGSGKQQKPDRQKEN